VISVAFKTPLETRLGICIYKTSLLRRPDVYIGFTLSCTPHFTTKWHPRLHHFFNFVLMTVTYELLEIECQMFSLSSKLWPN